MGLLAFMRSRFRPLEGQGAQPAIIGTFPVSSLQDIRTALAEIDIPAAEQALLDAEASREDVLLVGDYAEVIAAEAEITKARIDRDRAIARTAQLEVQLAEAISADAHDGIRQRHEQATRLADEATKAIEVEYPNFAIRIIDLADRERRADEAIAAVMDEAIAAGLDLPDIPTPSSRIWARKYLSPRTFRERLSLPETDGNPAHGAASREVTMEAAFALGGVGQPPPVPVFQ